MTIEHSEKRHKIFPGSNPAALREINRLNKQFWSKQSKLTVQRVSDPILYGLATRDMYSEAIRVAFREQKSLDQALSDAEQTLNVLWGNFVPAEQARRRSLGRQGGRAPKTDVLRVLIEACVRKTPDISQRELWHQLKKNLGLGIITAIDNHEIKFLAHSGKSKTAPISGLKDRLSRAAKSFDSSVGGKCGPSAKFSPGASAKQLIRGSVKPHCTPLPQRS